MRILSIQDHASNDDRLTMFGSRVLRVVVEVGVEEMASTRGGHYSLLARLHHNLSAKVGAHGPNYQDVGRLMENVRR